jgi:predicted phosphohydrolase
MMTTGEHQRVFAIGDLHLPGGADKSMDVFGAHWKGHFERIAEDWKARVTPADVVLIPGDISWAMRLEDALPDMDAIAALPGHKVMIRGNHDYWWNSIGKVRGSLKPGLYALQNDAVRLGEIVCCGSRGWLIPGETADADTRKIYARELLRMELSLQQGIKLLEEKSRLVTMIHFPPCDELGRENEMTRLFEHYGVHDVVYGHLHGAAGAHAFSGTQRGISYHPVSCDGLGFRLYELPVLS